MTTDDATRVRDLRTRIDTGRVRIDAARKKGFDVTAWEAQWNDLRREHDALADKVFSGTSKEEAA